MSAQCPLLRAYRTRFAHFELAAYYAPIGRPSIDPVLMIRMLIVGYVFAIRSERQIRREVQVNLAYRWFCGLGLEDGIPDHSVFSRARNERFRESDIFRRIFECVVASCIEVVPEVRSASPPWSARSTG
jgi:transposase